MSPFLLCINMARRKTHVKQLYRWMLLVSITIRTLTDVNRTCFRLTSQCIFIYFSATRYDRRYYVIILLNVTLNTISVGKTVQRKPRRSCLTICCTRRNPFNRTNGKFPSVYAFVIIPVCLGCVTPSVAM